MERTLRALEATAVEGTASNIEFLRNTIAHPEFRKGSVFTGFVEAHKPELLA
ncbi:MAG TPA: hypothetical protein VFC24_06695 [Casimicrobiaceae bacterium]|nr:hypothetical protein [Casimicrobiaceae bacterium]